MKAGRSSLPAKKEMGLWASPPEPPGSKEDARVRRCLRAGSRSGWYASCGASGFGSRRVRFSHLGQAPSIVAAGSSSRCSSNCEGIGEFPERASVTEPMAGARGSGTLGLAWPVCGVFAEP